MTAPAAPTKLSESTISAYAFDNLLRVVRVDSASDETSPTIPSTPGQAELARALVGYFEQYGAQVEVDEHANLIASIPGRGALANAEPLALLVHLDTARGTAATDTLQVVEAWSGEPLRFAANPSISVSTETYPTLAAYRGHDVVHGAGDAPFGLDDKLGLTHMMTLARLLAEHPDVPHRPLLLIGRPDEEIGRMDALAGLVDRLAARGVRLGYTVDGLDPFEINVENFNAAGASMVFAGAPFEADGGLWFRVDLGGVNTHGATAKAEGHRAATRFAAEIRQHLVASEADVHLAGMECDALRDCDAVALYWAADAESAEHLHAAVAAVVSPHVVRGASFSIAPSDVPMSGAPRTVDGIALHEGAEAAVAFIGTFLGSKPGFTLLAEESDDYDGYSQPYRIRHDDGSMRLDLRIRDFTPAGLEKRKEHIRSMAGARPLEMADQYVNMGPALAERPEVVSLAETAAKAAGVTPLRRPIRGGTGVDPFLERGIAIGNLGTGYFAPESEKELTSLQFMAKHAQWLFALVQLA